MLRCPDHPDVALTRVPRGWYCHECDRRVEPMAVEDDPQADTALAALPFPVAYPLFHARRADLPVGDRLSNLTFAAYQAMRLTALFLLAEYIASDQTDRRVASAINGLRLPHWQEWSHLCDALARHWTSERPSSPTRFPSLTSGWLTVNHEREPWDRLIAGLPGNQGDARSLNDALWRMRNDRAHRLATRTDPALDRPVLETFAPIVDALVAQLFPPGAFRLVRAVAGGSVVHLHGPHPDLAFIPEPADPSWHPALTQAHVAAIVDDTPLSVYPLLVPDTDQSTEPPDEPALLLDGVKPSRLLLLGVCSHGTSTAHHQAFTDALERKRVAFGTSRRTVKPWTIREWSRASALDELEQLRGRKYFPDCYVERAGIDDAIDRCLERPGRALLLLGPPGAGKSSLACRLVERLLAEDGAPVLFLSGRAAYAGSPELTADRLLADALAQRAGVRPGSFTSAAELMAHLDRATVGDQRPDRRVWVVLDALNEADRFAELCQALDRFLPALGRYPWLRLLVSLRSGAYRSLERRSTDLGRSGEGVFTQRNHLHGFLDPQTAQEHPWLTMRRFDESEAAEAYARRQRALPERACVAPWDRLSAELRELLSSPLHLHVFHDTFEGQRTAPTAVDESRLFGAYLDALVADLPSMAETLDAIGRHLLTERRPDLPADTADRWVEAWRREVGARHGHAAVTARLDPLEQLVSASVLLRPANEGFGVERHLVAFTFTHQALCEQVLLRELERAMAPRTLPEPTELLTWAVQAAGSPDEAAFAELQGALRILAQRCVQAGDGEPIAALLELDCDTTRAAIMGAAVRALGPIWGTDAEGSEQARRVLQALEQAALAAGHRGLRLQAAAWQGRHWLRQAGHHLAASAVSALLSRTLREQVNRQPGRADLRVLLATHLDELGTLARNAGRTDQATRYHDESLGLMRELVAMEPTRTERRNELAICLQHRARVAVDTGESDVARHLLRESLELVMALVEAEPGRADLRWSATAALNALADLDLEAGNSDSARLLFETSLRMLRALVAHDPERTDQRRELALTLKRLGKLELSTGRPAQAARYQTKALRELRGLVDSEPHRVDLRYDLAVFMGQSGLLALQHGTRSEARPLLEDSLRILRELVAAAPYRSDWAKDLSWALDNRANLARLEGRLQQAASLARESAELMRSLVAAEPQRADLRRELSVSLNQLGVLSYETGRLDESIHHLDESNRLMRALFEAEPHSCDLGSEYATGLHNMGHHLGEAGRSADALRHTTEAVALMRALVAQDPQRTDRRARLGNFLNSLGTCAYTLGDVDRARKHLEEALRVTRVLVEQLPQQSELREQLCLARGHLARLEVESGRRRRAMKLLEQNMATMAELVAAQPQRVDLRTSLAAYHWNYRPFVRSRRKKRAQLRTILEILRPVRAAAADDAELRRLWDGASRALGE